MLSASFLALERPYSAALSSHSIHGVTLSPVGWEKEWIIIIIIIISTRQQEAQRGVGKHTNKQKEVVDLL